MATFEEILAKKWDDIEPPKALPEGSYLGIVDGPYIQVKSQEKQTPGFQFNIKLVSPFQVDDMKALQEAGGCAGKTVRHTIYVSENNEHFLKQFLEGALGINGSGKPLLEALAEAPGRQCVVNLKHTMTRPRGGEEARLIHIVDSVTKA